MRRAAAAAALAASLPPRAAAWSDGTSSADLRRAFKSRPYADSHVAAETPDGVFASMNRHLSAGEAPTRPCEEWDHGALDGLLRQLNTERDPALDKVYANRNDKRALHFDSMEYKEALWVEEKVADAVGSTGYNLTRNGKCAELVMWWIHHLPQRARAALAKKAGFRIPQLPTGGPAMRDVARGKAPREYVYQIQCISCHLAMPCERYAENKVGFCPFDNATKTPSDEPKVGRSTQVCPPNPDTGKAWVFYNRTKRCEWDFDPPCAPCEGIGGAIWGDGEDEWKPAYCKPLLKPEEIPDDNLTTPVWPKAFTSQEFSCGSINSVHDPCAPKAYSCKDGKHGGWTIYYRQHDMADYPTPPDWPLTGMQPEQRQDLPSLLHLGVNSTQWTLPNGNMYGLTYHPKACACFDDPNRQPPFPQDHPGGQYSLNTTDPFLHADNVIFGPLRWDFPKDSVLVGREEIEVEWTAFGTQDSSRIVVADHWNKGPHHFWYEVSTNLMIRQYQAEAALTTQVNYVLQEPDPSLFVIPEICYKGLLHYNISCVSPPPSSP